MNHGRFMCIKLRFTRCYMLEYHGGYLIVDTSYPDCYSGFLNGLSKLRVKPSEIKYITHPPP
ncbi:MAG: hypothetical protein SWK76_17750 [Actinomycetota bacterium]|nr:hypothetical protein [Actinomycetota bacterium]